jgi:pimeloyl-ACP methyl ester carboxylesterase
MTLHSGAGRVDFEELGADPGAASRDGPAILFVPGSFSTPAAWRPVCRRLPQGRRLAATSLPGYGATEETRTFDDLDMAHEVRAVRAAARHMGARVVLVGHSFGGTVCLAAALAGAVDLRGIATFEANPLALMRAGGRQDLHDKTLAMSHAFEAAEAAGERDAAGRDIAMADPATGGRTAAEIIRGNVLPYT